MNEEREHMDEQTYLDRMQAAEQVLYRVACTLLDSEADRRDAMQETALRAWEKRDTLRQEQYFQTWAVRIMINVCRTMHRQRRRMTVTEDVGDRPAPQGDPELRLALDALPERYRLPLVLHYLEGLSVEEIARTLRMPAGTVKFNLHQARKALRVELEGKEA